MIERGHSWPPWPLSSRLVLAAERQPASGQRRIGSLSQRHLLSTDFNHNPRKAEEIGPTDGVQNLPALTLSSLFSLFSLSPLLPVQHISWLWRLYGVEVPEAQHGS